MKTIAQQKNAYEVLRESFQEKRAQIGRLSKKKQQIEEEMQVLDQKITEQKKELQTRFVNCDDVVFEVLALSDFQAKYLRLNSGENLEEYFYSHVDAKIHRVEAGTDKYITDESGSLHPASRVHKVIASNDGEKYPSLRVLTIHDIALRSGLSLDKS